jgi:hypothetical protein
MEILSFRIAMELPTLDSDKIADERRMGLFVVYTRA